MATNWTIAQVVSGGGVEKEIRIHKDLVIRHITFAFNSIGSVAASDTYQCLNLRAGEVVLMAGIVVQTATTAAATGDLGFVGGTADHFCDGMPLNATTLPTPTKGEGDGPVWIATADTLDLTLNAQSPAGGRIKVWALIARMS